MTAWWSALRIRERCLVTVGSYVFGVAALFLLLVEPVHTALIVAHQRLERELTVTAELEIKAREARLLRTQVQAPRDRAPGQSLFALINTTAGESNVEAAIVRITPRGEDEVALVFDNAAFDELAAWLVVIATEFGIDVVQAAVNRQDLPGRVSGNLTLVYLPAFTPIGSYRRSGAISRAR